MKTYLLIVAALIFSINVQSQTAVSHGKPKDCCKMAENIMFVVKNGVTTTMATDMIMLKNGTVIMLSGMVITKAGKKTQLKNGESINMQGMVYLTPKDKSKVQAAR